MELLEIHPRELAFTFELRKQSSCSVHLVNKTDEYVAFKVKTTSPKRYCVRPNIGVIPPRSTCDFTVTMQAQKTAPPDMQLKDKFLIQSTVAPYGSADEDILPNLFSKDTGRYIGENKLRVVLINPTHSSVLQPLNGTLKEERSKEDNFAKDALAVKDVHAAKVVPPAKETLVEKETYVRKEAPFQKETSDVKETPDLKGKLDVEETPVVKGKFDVEETPVVKEEENVDVQNQAAPVNETSVIERQLPLIGDDLSPPSNKMKEIEDLKLKISSLESKLNEVDKTIGILKEEKSYANQERDKLQEELKLLRRASSAIPAGFPFLFVVFMALVGAYFGYMLHS